MTLLAADGPQRMKQRGRRYQIAGAIVALAIIGLTVRMGMEDPDRSVASLIIGLLCGIGLFAGLPWMIGAVKQRHARQRVHINGTQVTVVGLVKRAPNVLDMRTTRASVELVGGPYSDNTTKHLAQGSRMAIYDRRHQVERGAINLSKRYFVPYHPVLVLFRPEDEFALPVELCHVASGRMRDRAEILLLERVLRYSHDPGTQHAAGQLRTIATWQRLPHITDAASDAVPATPPDHPHAAGAIPTPVRAGAPSPEITVAN